MGFALKFLMGGIAVTLATLLSQRIGKKAGGFLAGFPAVFTSALLLGAVAHPGPNTDMVLEQMAIGGSTSFVGTFGIAYLAPRLFHRTRFIPGYLMLVIIWLVLAGVTALTIHTLSAS